MRAIAATPCIVILFLAAAALIPQAAHRLPAEDRPLAGQLEDLFVVGRDVGADHELLFGLVDIAFAPGGELFVLEERNRRVLEYGPAGEYVRQFGREGQGPGEFQLPMTLAVTSNGEIVVWDFQNRWYSLFTPDGDFSRTVRWGDWASGPRRDTLRPWPAGGVVYLQSLLHEDSDPPDDIDRGFIAWEPLAEVGGPVEVLEVHHPRRRGRQVAGTLVLDSGPAFAPVARWDVLSDGRLAVADGVEYRVRLVPPEGGSIQLLERSLAPRPTGEADRQRERDRVRKAYDNAAGVRMVGGSGSPRSSSRTDQIVESIVFADVLPVIRDLAVDYDDRLWIQRHGETFFDDGPIDIVTAEGDYIGTLPAMRMPDAFGPDGMAAWMERGAEVEVERVIVRRLPASLR